jgi:3-hydroxyisobutyrate dehydrogenase
MTVCPVGSALLFAESVVTSGQSRLEGRGLKLALNQLIAAEMSPFALSLGLVQRATVPIDTFTAILRENALFSPALEKKLPRLLTRDYKHPNFSARHLLKDVELFLKEASSYELTASSLEEIRQVLERNIAQRLGYSDYSGIFEMVNPIP